MRSQTAHHTHNATPTRAHSPLCIGALSSQLWKRVCGGRYLEMSMVAMNAQPDPEAEDRKGCSGHVGKMIFSASAEQLAIVAYVPGKEHNKSAEKVDCGTWVGEVIKAIGGELVKPVGPADSPNGGVFATAVCKSDPSNGKFAIKDKDTAMAAAFAFLRANGAFPEDDGDDSDEMVFGDDDNLDDY